jgi:hypothetical protein
VIPVWDPAGVLTAAIAELPASVRASDHASGAIAIVAGSDWSANVTAAVDAGARAILVIDPDSAAPAALARATEGRPVVVLRPRLAAAQFAAARFADAAGALATPPAAVVAECSAPSSELAAVVRDAIGWARTLAGSGLELGWRGATASGRLASLTAAGGIPVSVLARALSGVPSGGLIRVTALGTPRRELVVDEPAGAVRITVSDELGATVLPHVFESLERGALRRMVAAVETGDRPDDVTQFIHDMAIAEKLLQDFDESC